LAINHNVFKFVKLENRKSNYRKCFYTFERHVYQNGERESMPMATGRVACYSSFEIGSLSVSEFMENVFGTVPVNPVCVHPLITIENWPHFTVIDVNFTLSCPALPCVLSGVDIKPMGVLKLL